MTNLLLSLLTIEVFGIFIWGFLRKDRMIQFPFQAAAVFVGWMLPQLIGLSNHPSLPPGSLAKAVLMASLCLAAAWCGYRLNRRPTKLFDWQFNRRRLIFGSIVLSVAGAFFFHQVSVLAPDATEQYGGAWTGIITIYFFFSRLLTVGMAIALILHLNKPGWLTLSVLLFDLTFYLDRIVIQGRRAEMVELGLMVLMALWFQRRWLLPRWAMLGLLVTGTLLVNSIGDYRRTMLGDSVTSWSGAGLGEVLEIDYVDNLRRLVAGESGNHELENAVMTIEAVDRTLIFDFGLSHWNGLVNAYVPAQWVGAEFKQALTVALENPTYPELRYVPNPGSTHTGLSDAFMSFWYFGALKFFIIGWIMSRWFRGATRGNLVAQIVVMLSISASLHAITHSTHQFFTVFVQIAAFLLPVLVFARQKRRRAQFMVDERLPTSDRATAAL